MCCVYFEATVRPDVEGSECVSRVKTEILSMAKQTVHPVDPGYYFPIIYLDDRRSSIIIVATLYCILNNAKHFEMPSDSAFISTL
jgi:hypothetical protein